MQTPVRPILDVLKLIVNAPQISESFPPRIPPNFDDCTDI